MNIDLNLSSKKKDCFINKKKVKNKRKDKEIDEKGQKQ